MFTDEELLLENTDGCADTLADLPWTETDRDEYEAWLDTTAAIERERRGESYWPTPLDLGVAS